MRLPLSLVAVSSLVLLHCSSAAPNSNGDGGPTSDGAPQQSDSGSQSDASSQGDSSLGAPAPVSVNIQASCPTINACGGDPTGTWDYASGCAEVNLDQVKQACSGASVTNVAATVAGRVTFGAGSVSRSYDLQYSATVNVPSTCAQPAGGCSVIQGVIAPSFDTATCADDGSGGCKCDVTGHDQGAGATTYTVQGTDIVTGDGNSYAFCVQGGTMSYRHTNGSSPEAGSFQLTKR